MNVTKVNLIVTRHPGLTQWLAAHLEAQSDAETSVCCAVNNIDGRTSLTYQTGPAVPDADHPSWGWTTRVIPVVAHVTADDVAGKHVIGVLPLSLARHAASVTEVEMTLRPDQRGKELSVAEMDAAGARLSEPLCVRSLTLVLCGVEALRDGSADGNRTAGELRDGR